MGPIPPISSGVQANMLIAFLKAKRRAIYQCKPRTVMARQQSAMPVIGVMHGILAAQWIYRMVGFHRGLGEAGFAEGRNVTIEYRWAEGQFDRLPAMAADLVGRKVAVICAGAGDVAIRTAMAATKTIPIVFTTASDPVNAGF